ncbi:MAG TPA: ribose 5-phosphate isomerase B [Bacilli bacterium]|nr:ribose 5-phosphate isomerase B [Bacilli bacterium]
MVISIGSDHGGYLLKEKIVKFLEQEGYTVLNRGCDGLESVDYPLYGMRVCRDVLTKKCDLGILICTTGVGMSIVANKHRGIRAALVHNADMARLTREHNDSNILCLGAKYTTEEQAYEMVRAFIESKFAGERHQRRVDMIMKLEEKQWQEEK